MTETAEEARCPECHMPLSMHHDPACSQPCGRCEARKARITETYVLQMRLSPPRSWEDAAKGDWADPGVRAEALAAFRRKEIPGVELRMLRRTEEVLEG